METYKRNGKIGAPQESNKAKSTQSAPAGATAAPEDSIQIDGFLQVVEMLEVADAEFRKSLLRRIQAQDPQLANRILRELTARHSRAFVTL